MSASILINCGLDIAFTNPYNFINFKDLNKSQSVPLGFIKFSEHLTLLKIQLALLPLRPTGRVFRVGWWGELATEPTAQQPHW